MIYEDMFDWNETNCCCCNNSACELMGYRGGEAHKEGKGIKCSIVRCLNCGHIYPKPMPVFVDTNKGYKDPDEYFINNDPAQQVEIFSLLLEEVEKKLGYKGKILDVGSGRGELLYAAKKMGWQAEGVETSEEFTSYSKMKYGVEVNNCTLESAEYPSEQFDVITLGAVIEHLYNPDKMLKEINRILKLNGILWIDAPNESSLYNVLGNLYFKILGKNWVSQLSPTFPPYHVQGFTKKSINTLLLRTGFRIESLRTFNKKLLLPRTGSKQNLMYFGAHLINDVSTLFNNATFMNVFTRKTGNPS
jgi:2-polyprenyl-3-methyl-5-hydroxy-6-metoxy-1,4-benzoquinol methylase